MKIIFLSFFLIFSFGHTYDERNLFDAFIKKFQKNYQLNSNEYNYRFQMFKTSLKRIENLNNLRKTNSDAIFGITQYSDLTTKEFFSKMMNNQNMNKLKKIDSDSLESINLNKNYSIKTKNLTKLDKIIESYLSFSNVYNKNDWSLINEYNQNTNINNQNKNLNENSNKNDESSNENLNKINQNFNKNLKNKHSLKMKRNLKEIKKNIKSNRVKRDTDYYNFYDKNLPSNIPRAFDWRDLNVISKVEDQGSCGACWAHSTIETIESMTSIKYKKPVIQLSVQQLIDCSTNNFGCLGGDTCSVLTWIVENRIKILNEKAYPKKDNASKCKINNDQIASGVTVKNFTCNNYVDKEIELIKILATHGPVATIADATLWRDYLGGIIQFNCEREANHAVQIVGYNLKNSVPYYIVRNTWGKNFGINGYLHVAIGNNLCALEEKVSIIDVDMI